MKFTMKQFIKKMQKIVQNYITDSGVSAEFSETRERETQRVRDIELVKIINFNQKTAEAVFKSPTSKLIEKKLLPRDSDFGLADYDELASQFGLFGQGQKLQKYFRDFIAMHLANQHNNDTGALGNIKPKNITKTSVKSKQNSTAWFREFINVLITSANESCLFNSENVKTGGAQSNCQIGMDTFISEELIHASLVRDFQNFFFTQNSRGVSNTRFSVGDSDAGILLGDISQPIANSEQIQNIGYRNPSAMNTGLTKPHSLLNDNSNRLLINLRNLFLVHSDFVKNEFNYYYTPNDSIESIFSEYKN